MVAQPGCHLSADHRLVQLRPACRQKARPSASCERLAVAVLEALEVLRRRAQHRQAAVRIAQRDRHQPPPRGAGHRLQAGHLHVVGGAADVEHRIQHQLDRPRARRPPPGRCRSPTAKLARASTHAPAQQRGRQRDRRRRRGASAYRAAVPGAAPGDPEEAFLAPPVQLRQRQPAVEAPPGRSSWLTNANEAGGAFAHRVQQQRHEVVARSAASSAEVGSSATRARRADERRRRLAPRCWPDRQFGTPVTTRPGSPRGAATLRRAPAAACAARPRSGRAGARCPARFARWATG